MQEQFKNVGSIIALIVLVLSVVAIFVGKIDPVTGLLLAGLALAIMLK